MGIIMGKSVVEERGRILIPKEIRDELNLRPGQKVTVEKKENTIIISPATDWTVLKTELRGCVKKSEIDPMDMKKIWRM